MEGVAFKPSPRGRERMPGGAKARGGELGDSSGWEVRVHPLIYSLRIRKCDYYLRRGIPPSVWEKVLACKAPQQRMGGAPPGVSPVLALEGTAVPVLGGPTIPRARD